MDDLECLAKKYYVYEKSDSSDFQRKARVLQSMWRTETFGEDYIGIFKNRKLGSLLPMPDTKETLSNYLTDTIRDVVKKEVIKNNDNDKLYGKPRIFNNLLSSQPLCFNLFAELQQDLELATKAFKKLAPERVKQVTKINFEYSPGRGDRKYTADGSAFDVYVEYLTSDKKNGFIGIEVKYHENLKNKPAEIKKRYFEIAKEMGCFKDECLDKLQTLPLEQIWRDHLLAGSILVNRDFTEGFFVFLYPKDNLHCKDAVQNYKTCLSDNKTFKDWTLEKVVEAIKGNINERWIDDLIDRYLNFDKLQKAALR